MSTAFVTRARTRALALLIGVGVLLTAREDSAGSGSASTSSNVSTSRSAAPASISTVPSASATSAQGLASPLSGSRIIQYRGPMPLLPESAKEGEITLTFEIYRSPTGGVPVWSETRTVEAHDRVVNVDLGQVEPLPDEAFTSPFRFLAIWHQNVELRPRKQIVSVAYLAASAQEYAKGGAGVVSTAELKAAVAGDVTASAATPAPAAPGNAPVPMGATVDAGGFAIEGAPRAATTWVEAERIATQLGARLPTYEEWYEAVDGPARVQLGEVAGHYEWVVPWVYDPQIHARMHELYRGKPVACYYDELSPQRNYPYRLVAVTGR